MGKAALKYDTHILVNRKDLQKYLTLEQEATFLSLYNLIHASRKSFGREVSFAAVMADEPYFYEVLDLILEREGEKDDK